MGEGGRRPGEGSSREQKPEGEGIPAEGDFQRKTVRRRRLDALYGIDSRCDASLIANRQKRTDSHRPFRPFEARIDLIANFQRTRAPLAPRESIPCWRLYTMFSGITRFCKKKSRISGGWARSVRADAPSGSEKESTPVRQPMTILFRMKMVRRRRLDAPYNSTMHHFVSAIPFARIKFGSFDNLGMMLYDFQLGTK